MTPAGFTTAGFVRWATPTETEHRPAPAPGLAWAWVDATQLPAELAWAIATANQANQYRCRHSTRNPCPARPVAILTRTTFRSGRRLSTPWGYCAEHLYGRRFEGGRILTLTRVETPS